MKKTAEELIKKLGKCEGEHTKFLNMYEDVYTFGMPNRYQTIKDVDVTGQKNRERIFSSIFEQCCDEFVQRFQSLICPVNTDWIDFEAGYVYSKNDGAISEVNKELSKIANICNTYKSTSNFDTAFTEASYDLIAGTTCLCLLDGDSENPLKFSAIPFKELYMSEGANGEIDCYFRKFKVKNYLVKNQWKDARFEYSPSEEDNFAELIEATYLDYDTKNWNYAVIDCKKKNVIVERLFKSSPFIDLRWSKCAGETYGRGVGLKTIADVKTHNKIKEYSLRALAFAVPVFTVSTDDGYNPEGFVFEPAALNPVPSNQNNNPTVRQLEVNQMPDLVNYNITQLEMDIKKAMFASTIPNDPTQMTATEVAQRVSELDNSLNNSFGRLLEFLYRLSRRIIEVLQNFGYISPEFEVQAFNGYGYKIKINTQLANQQTKKEVSDILQSVQYMVQLDPSMSYMNKAIKLNELVPYVLEKMGVPNQFIRTSEEIDQLQDQDAQAMAQQQQQMAQMDVEVANAKEQGKADAQSRLQR